MKPLPILLFPLDAYNASLHQRIVRNQQNLRQAYETVTLARRQLDSLQRRLGNQVPLAPQP